MAGTIPAMTTGGATAKGKTVIYELPREMWENDIQGAIDFLENLPTEGPEALVDRTDSPAFGQTAPAPAK